MNIDVIFKSRIDEFQTSDEDVIKDHLDIKEQTSVLIEYLKYRVDKMITSPKKYNQNEICQKIESVIDSLIENGTLVGDNHFTIKTIKKYIFTKFSHISKDSFITNESKRYKVKRIKVEQFINKIDRCF